MAWQLIYLLENTVQNYAWGSHEFIAELCGKTAPSTAPEAELWMGAHVSAPSLVLRGAERLSLRSLIAEDPERLLGARVHAEFVQLPFLLKVLAAAQPLSLQAHPSRERARAGYLEEERRGIPLAAASRNYKDDNHKPELVVALTEFVALCGFRELSRTRQLLALLGVPELQEVLRANDDEASEDTLRGALEHWLHLPEQQVNALVGSVQKAASTALLQGQEFQCELRWAMRLAAAYPNDPGTLCALLLNLVQLTPGQGLYLPAGNLHAYLRGAGIELMASSDNVLRGGLTSKHVDVQELLRVLDFSELSSRPLEAQALGDGEHVYVTPAREFQLATHAVSSSAALTTSTGPEIVLVTRGRMQLQSGDHSVSLGCGGSAFISAGTPYLLSGNGFVYRASVP